MENDEQDEYFNREDVLEVIELAEQHANGNSVNDDRDSGAGESDEEDAEAAEGPSEPMVEEIEDHSVTTFSSHSGEVFSVDISPTYAVSGGEDDHAYVWKLEDGSSVLECTGHSDSVTFVRFNGRKTLLATASMDGLIQVWRMKDFSKVTEVQVGDLSWLQWHHAADILFCGTEDGSMWMYLVPNGDCKVYAGYGPPCSVGVLFPDGKRLCAGYGDGGVRIWDLKNSTFVNIEGASVHQSAVTCADVSQDNSLLATGCEEGTVNLIHAGSGKILASFICSRQTGRTQQEDSNEDTEMEDSPPAVSVETIAFSKVSPLLFTGTVNGEMAIWDLNSHVVRQTLPSQEGVVKATWLDHCILVADLGGNLRLYDSRNGELVTQWLGHKGAVLDFNLSTDQSILVSGSSDHTCKVFRLDSSR